MSEKKQGEEQKCVNWLPLESNPSVLNKFAHDTGMGQDWAFCDVYGVDPDLLSMVPQPCTALILLFPSASKNEAGEKIFHKAREEEKEKIDKSGQKVSENVFYITQHDGSGNSCGSIACLHAVSNSSGMTIKDGALKKFFDSNKGKKADEIGYNLMEAYDLFATSEASAQSGESETPDREADVGHHFIAFVTVDGDLYELDGRKAYPINHGPTSSEDFLKNAALVVKKNYMELDPTNYSFSLMALAKNPEC